MSRKVQTSFENLMMCIKLPTLFPTRLEFGHIKDGKIIWISNYLYFHDFNVCNIALLYGIIVGYQPEKIRPRRYLQKINENDQYATQSRENESCFHYLCL